MSLPQERTYTLKDIYALPDGQRAELIDGQIYDMAPPARIHQHLLMNLSALIHDYIKSQSGDCLVYPAPFAVFLNMDERNYVEPDISVICDKSKPDDKGCNGAPDRIIEIVSASTQQMDYGSIRAEEMEQGFIATGGNCKAAYDGGNTQEVSTCHKADNYDHKPSVGCRSGETGSERGKSIFNKV